MLFEPWRSMAENRVPERSFQELKKVAPNALKTVFLDTKPMAMWPLTDFALLSLLKEGF
jgi:hypothetical protein